MELKKVVGIKCTISDKPSLFSNERIVEFRGNTYYVQLSNLGKTPEGQDFLRITGPQVSEDSYWCNVNEEVRLFHAEKEELVYF